MSTCQWIEKDFKSLECYFSMLVLLLKLYWEILKILGSELEHWESL